MAASSIKWKRPWADENCSNSSSIGGGGGGDTSSAYVGGASESSNNAQQTGSLVDMVASKAYSSYDTPSSYQPQPLASRAPPVSRRTLNNNNTEIGGSSSSSNNNKKYIDSSGDPTPSDPGSNKRYHHTQQGIPGFPSIAADPNLLCKSFPTSRIHPVCHKRQRVEDSPQQAFGASTASPNYQSYPLALSIDTASGSRDTGEPRNPKIDHFGTVVDRQKDTNIEAHGEVGMTAQIVNSRSDRKFAGERRRLKDCSTCDRASSVAPQIAKGLEQLHVQLKGVLSRDKAVISATEDGTTPQDTKSIPEDLMASLDWSLDLLNETLRAARDVSSSRNSSELATHKPSFGSTISGQSMYSDRTKRPSDAEEALSCRRASQFSPTVSDDGSRAQEQPSIVSERGTSTLRDGQLHGVTSHLGGNNYQLPPPSPTQSNTSNRVLPPLPSPSSMSFSNSNVLPPMSPSIGGGNPSRSPHTAYLQDLQHQLSTKSLAHRILQGEHEKLLSAYSRLQTRCATLDKKSQVSDAEINDLSEDRGRLQSEIDQLKDQVEDLQQSREEYQKQNAANGSQYMQIMALSSKLQVQGAADAKSWKAARDAWAEEKARLVERIGTLEAEKTKGGLVRASYLAAAPENETRALLEGDDVEALKLELVRAKQGKKAAENHLRAYREGSSTISRILNDLGAVGDSIKP